MQFRKSGEMLFGGRVGASILQVLAKFPSKGFTGRELARLADVSASQALAVLERLRQQNVVQSRRIGRSIEWKVNSQSALFNRLLKIIKEDAFLEMVCNDIKKAFSNLKSLRKIILFGSVARGNESPNSDIDLLLILDDARDKPTVEEIANSLSIQTSSKYGNPVSALVYMAAELQHKPPALLKNIEKEGIVLLDR